MLILHELLPDYQTTHDIRGSYLHYPTATPSCPMSIHTGDLLALCHEWVTSHSYVLLSGTTDTGQYICYYDHIPSYPRDYYIDQYDYYVAPTHIDAVLLACEAIYSTVLDTL